MIQHTEDSLGPQQSCFVDEPAPKCKSLARFRFESFDVLAVLITEASGRATWLRR